MELINEEKAFIESIRRMVEYKEELAYQRGRQSVLDEIRMAEDKQLGRHLYQHIERSMKTIGRGTRNKVQVTLTVEVDVDSWCLAYGIGEKKIHAEDAVADFKRAEEVRKDVVSALNSMRLEGEQLAGAPDAPIMIKEIHRQ